MPTMLQADPETLAVQAARAGIDRQRSSTALPVKRMRMQFPMLIVSLVSSATAAEARDPVVVNNHSTFHSYDTFDIPVVELPSEGSTVEVSGVSNWLAGWAHRAEARTFATAILDELEGLEDGWNGDKSAAPNGYIKSDLKSLVGSLGTFNFEPEVEVDNDGSVALRWETEERVLALTINGNGRAIGTMYPRTENFPREIALKDRDALAEFLSIDEVRSVIS